MGGTSGGRPPKPDGQRRSHHRLLADVKTRLPATGRIGPTPPWPLERHADPKGRKEEARMWRQMWRLPQALVWELQNMDLLVARFVRLHVDWRTTGLLAITAELRTLEDRLGLSPMALLRLRWTIEEEVPEAAGDHEKVVDIRHRLKALD